MKNSIKLAAAALFFALAGTALAEDKYDVMAKEISEAGSGLANKKIAIIPFSYADGRASSKDGAIVSEKLTMRIIKQRSFDVIERSVLDKVMAELKLQSSGAMDATSTKELGKLLGVEAIVTGTLVEMQGGQIEVNARMIKTETAQAIGASQAVVRKDWMGGDASSAPQQQPAYQQPAYEQPAYQQPAHTPPARYARPRGEYEYGFVDIFLGFGSPNMSVEFANSVRRMSASELAPWSTPAGTFSSVKADKLKTGGFGPLALRIGGYGNGPVGGAFEMGLESRFVAAQTAPFSFDGVTYNKMIGADDWLKVTTFHMAGDLLFRFTKKSPVEPYFGMGLGLTLNAVNMPYTKGFTNSSYLSAPVEDFGVGVMGQFPVGIRAKIGDSVKAIAELRYQFNRFTFDRGISGETDTVTLSGAYFNLGIGFGF